MVHEIKPSVKRLFWDIETSYNIFEIRDWRAGFCKLTLDYQDIIREKAIICICYKWEGQRKIHSLQWDGGDDEQMIIDFAEIAEQADELIAHNGDKFDIRWFNGRNAILELPPLPEYKTVDTCAIARRKFYYNSYKLDYLTHRWFGERKNPMVREDWDRIINSNCEQSMRKMIRYCKRDVELLEMVWERLQPYYKPKSHAGVHMGRPRWTCHYCGSKEVGKSKNRTTAMGMLQHQMKCKDCGGYYTISDLVFRQYQFAKKEKI